MYNILKLGTSTLSGKGGTEVFVAHRIDRNHTEDLT